MEDQLSQLDTSINQKFNLKKTISQYTKHWKWFLLSVIVFIGLTYLHLRYTVPQYRASSDVMILNDDNDDNSANKIFKDLSLSDAAEDASIEDEILVFKSRNVLKNVVKRLNLNTQYFTQGIVLETEMYTSTPIQVNFATSDSIVDATNFSFYVDIKSNKLFDYRIHEDDSPKEFSFGENIATPFGVINILPKSDNIKNISIRVKLTSVSRIVESLRNKVYVYPSQNGSRILTINMEDPVVKKAKDIINTLIEEYDKYTEKIKNRKSKGTADLIDSRISRVANDLLNVDDSIVRFKINNKVTTDVSLQAGQFSNLSFQNEQEIQAINTKLRLLKNTQQLLSGNANIYQTIPTNLGDPTMVALSVEYNRLISERENTLKSAGVNNPIVLALNQNILNIRTNLKQNIDATLRTLDIQLTSLQNQYQSVSSKISSVPIQENKLRSIERKKGIKESIYLYLLQKKEEAIISQTVTSSNVKIIDKAYSLGKVSPNGKILYIGALFIGFILPFGFIYVKDLLDNKIHNKEDLQNEVKNIPVIGEIPRLKRKDQFLLKKNDRSILSESFRIIRTNFGFIKKSSKDVKEYHNVMFVTSTINGEGKSFFSMNMALTIASTGKKVLLIGADIRNPQIFSGLKKNDTDKTQKSEFGLTEYLSDASIDLEKTISKYSVNKIELDVLLSGQVPPNPAELLMNDEKLKALFDTASNKYDYVLVDTAPSMLVTDTLLISKYAAYTIYLTRSGYTEKEILSFVNELKDNAKLNGLMLVVNDVDQSNFGYGAKYGYYGAPKKKRWFSLGKA